jgi:hypothetical protein
LSDIEAQPSPVLIAKPEVAVGIPEEKFNPAEVPKTQFSLILFMYVR